MRAMAAIVVGAAFLMLVGLSRPWAEASFAGDGVEDVEQADDDQRLDVELYPTGRVQVEPGDADSRLVERYEGDDNAAARAALRQAVSGGARDLAQVFGVLVALVAAVGVWRELTGRTWVLLSAAALACLVTVVLLRDDVLSALATGTASMDVGVRDTNPTTWSAVAVAGAVTAALVSWLAAGPRPARPMNPFRAVRRGRSTVPLTRPDRPDRPVRPARPSPEATGPEWVGRGAPVRDEAVCLPHTGALSGPLMRSWRS
jgi:hypothetical protein